MLSGWPQSLSIGDLDGDGNKDVVVANQSNNNVLVMRNNSVPGAVSFSQTDLSVLYHPWQVWLNDLDGEGKIDLCVGRESDSWMNPNKRYLSLYKNTSTAGSISFSTPVSYQIGEYTNKSVSGDLNDDGKPEIVVFNSTINSVGAVLIFQNKVGVSGTVTICEGSNGVITSNITGNVYQWQQNTGSGFVNLSNSPSITGTNTSSLQLLSVPASWNGHQYRCVVGSDTSILSILQVNLLPAAIAGADKALCKDGDGTFIGGATVAGDKFDWSPTTGLSNADVGAPWATPTTTTQYILTVMRNGCVKKDTVTVFVLQPATPTISAAGTTQFCSGGSVKLSSSAATRNQWYNYDFPITGSTDEVLLVQSLGSYSVVSVINGCSSSPSNTVVVTTIPVPAAPTLTQNGNTLASSATDGNIWYLNGVAINNTSLPTFTPTASGVYRVKATNGFCTSSFSNAITVFTMPGILIGPNLVTDKLIIQYPNNTKTLSFRLMDMNGQAVSEKGVFVTSFEIDMRRYRAGTYILQIINERTGAREQRTVVKM